MTVVNSTLAGVWCELWGCKGCGSGTMKFSICCLCTATGSKQVCEYTLHEKSCFIIVFSKPTGFQPNEEFFPVPQGLVVPNGVLNSIPLESTEPIYIHPLLGQLLWCGSWLRLLFFPSLQELCSSFFMVLVVEALMIAFRFILNKLLYMYL